MGYLKQQLMEDARRKGICAEGYSHLRNGDADMLVDYYIQNPDWCLERDYPSLSFLTENFCNIEGKGVYVGKTFHGELLNDRQTYIFHNCRGHVRVGLNTDKAIIPMLYIANGCKIRFVGTGDYKPGRGGQRTVVPVYIFGRNDVSARDNAYVRFVHYRQEVI